MYKKIILLLLVFIITLSTVCFAETNGTGRVDADSLNIRSAPGIESQVIGSVGNGVSVEIITKTGEWYEIKYGSKTGFVHSNYIAASRHKSTDSFSSYDFTDETPSEKGLAIVEYAKQFLGVPYVWGGTSPSGFDCSGLVYYVYGKFDVKLYRTADDMAFNGKEVPLDAMKPGDIVLFWNRERYSGIHHCGIYVGDGNFIHAPQTGDVVKISTLKTGYYSTTVYAARRIFD